MSHLAVLALVLAVEAAPPPKPPEPGYAFPAGGRAGSAVEVTLGGYDWTPDVEFLTSDPRVKVELLAPPGPVLVPPPPYWFGPKGLLAPLPLPREAKARVTLPAGLPPGLVRWRTANAGGAGVRTGVFAVGQLPEVVEAAAGPSPQPLPALPVVVNGRLSKIEEADAYRFTAGRDGPVTLDLAARRLGSPFKAAVTVTDDTGMTVADAVDTEGRDVRLTFAAKAGRAYAVRLHDFDYAGDFAFVYRLTLTPGPSVRAAVPAAGKRGTTAEVEFLVDAGGPGLEPVKRAVAFPADAADTFAYSLPTPYGEAAAFDLGLADAADAPASGKLAGPGAVTGVLAGGAYRTALAAKKGEAWVLTAASRAFDAALAVAGPDGKELARADDTPEATDARLRFVAPADGEFAVTVSDAAMKSGGRDAVFRLTAEKEAADFALQLAAPAVNVPAGGTAAVQVTAVRQGGFTGPVELTLTGLPEGVTVAGPAVVAANQPAASVTLKAADNTPCSAAWLKVTGTAEVGGAKVTRPATVAWSAAPGTLAGREPAVPVAVTLKPRVKAKVVEADGGRKVHAGTTHPAEIAIERQEGYAGPVTLVMAATQSYQRQGIRGPELEVPPGKASAFYPCFMPEWLQSTRTSRMGVAAVVTVPDGKGRPRLLLHPVQGFVTMSLEGPILKVLPPPEPLAAKPGEKVTLAVKVLRAAKLPGPVKLELVPPEGLAGVPAAALELPPGKTEAAFAVTLPAGGALPEELAFTVRATGSTGPGLAVVSEAVVRVEPGRP